YDMSGNVWEWISDIFSRNYSSERDMTGRVTRGGSFYFEASNSRVCHRNTNAESGSGISLGLRLAL
ncbi:MAG: formylglycine-generating enzyme family protein, partial [Paramuribaculum sp.]|nr:formylglycine-generating enzyme family protein [Paramuribaculum sp.]